MSKWNYSNEGSEYIEKEFPLIDKFETCTVERIPASDKETEL